ncbi:unnamed protein product [Adineta steineri]|uniref:Heparan-alpha-glucosaminide N-acetyltransferase-like protein n=1 Tax=Adineta steineri TaxID=433720 RepID=A0A813RF55_9BILA|nr:unnamed protein product [Adineta steineri]CAF0923492.1 unnamed protein product [Adineta steineri]
MKQSLNFVWILFITIHLHYGQTQVIKNKLSDTLGMDEAFLTISNKNYSDSIVFLYNIVVCEFCTFDQLGDPLPTNSSQTLKIGTKYPYDIQVFTEIQNKTIQCNIQSYSFSENASYILEIIQINPNHSSCSINQTKPSSYYWTPVIILLILLCLLVFFIQLFNVLYKSPNMRRILISFGYQRLDHHEANVTQHTSPTTQRHALPIIAEDTDQTNIHNIINSPGQLPLVGYARPADSTIKTTKVAPKRLRGLDTFRGFSLMVMIFVNYGGGGYWFFDHSVWNGLTLADLVFPWFTWMMGVSVVLSQRSLLKKKVSKVDIFLKICRRTVILFFLGLILQSGFAKPKSIRILGVLQRLGLCYFFTAILVLISDRLEDESQWPAGNDVGQPIGIELKNTIFKFWPQWISILVIICTWIFITFIPKLDNCPRGYVGPGGKHYYGQYQNCTGGMAGYIDRTILGDSHLYGYPTCRDVYDTKIPYDPEGLMGILTGIFLCYLGVNAGHIFAHSTSVRRVCGQWIASGVICGFFGLLLSKGGHSDSWIPINKNLWSLSFIFVLASLAYIILTILYLLVDVKQWFTGEPWLWLGMNSIVLYVGHDVCSRGFPIQFQVNDTHPQLLAVHAYGVAWWIFISGILYYNKIFIAI